MVEHLNTQIKMLELVSVRTSAKMSSIRRDRDNVTRLVNILLCQQYTKEIKTIHSLNYNS